MRSALLFLGLAALAQAQAGPKAGSIVQLGSTKVSGMMMLLGSETKVYILDKVENNAEQINGHPAWAVEWDIASNTATLMDMTTNVFCASGMHMPNGTWATFGGNNAVGPTCPTNGANCPHDDVYGDSDGATAVRLLNPCSTGQSNCAWLDVPVMKLQKRRWYPGIEVLADGSSVLIGGFSNGGYINRNTPNTDPAYEGGAAEPTFEFWPPRGEAQVMDFMVRTSGLNSYAHSYLLPSGAMFVQANLSTIIWDYNTNAESPLPNMPNGIVRVYPGSGGVAMLPLTPDNGYTPTILFCGGQGMPDAAWGNYSYPNANTWELDASTDCQRITPEPTDGSPAVYVQDDDMPDPRTMGQFIILPDETLLMINGGAKGTAGYADRTGTTETYAQMPFGMSLSAAPVLKPAIYNPYAPPGSRWSDVGLQASTIPRLYHSSALLLPDGSVMISGSNPNVDVNLTTIYPTEYRAEKFYPPYFASPTRPKPTGIPARLSYGGAPFDITLGKDSYSGDANTAASKAKVVLVRTGFSTHAMNMGMKALRLNSTYTVSNDGKITIHTSQVPPNANVFQPGPTLLFVVVDGIPSIGKMVIVGNGVIGQQTMSAVIALPASVNSTVSTTGSGGGKNSGAVPSSWKNGWGVVSSFVTALVVMAFFQ